jgi:hypothetical protein
VTKSEKRALIERLNDPSLYLPGQSDTARGIAERGEQATPVIRVSGSQIAAALGWFKKLIKGEAQ